jgi:hypothetical protein
MPCEDAFDPLRGQYLGERQAGLQEKGVDNPLEIAAASIMSTRYPAHEKTLLGCD